MEIKTGTNTVALFGESLVLLKYLDSVLNASDTLESRFFSLDSNLIIGFLEDYTIDGLIITTNNNEGRKLLKEILGRFPELTIFISNSKELSKQTLLNDRVYTYTDNPTTDQLIEQLDRVFNRRYCI